MCTVCGCGDGEARIEGGAPAHPRGGFDYTPRRHHHHGRDHGHDLHHVHSHEHSHCDQGSESAHVPGMSQARMVQVERDILSKNDAYAAVNRKAFAERGIFAVNLVSSPGSGKTTLLVETIRRLGGSLPLAVIEGDQQTSHDAERIRAAGAPAIQVNTGKGCHLDAHVVGHAFERLDLARGLLLIENVGNLVCPAEFDLGEAHKVVILSVTEGEDKPLKYPNMFAAADLMLLTKVDLLPHLTFDMGKCIEYALRVNPRIETMQVSSTLGLGMEGWLDWLRRGVAGARKD